MKTYLPAEAYPEKDAPPGPFHILCIDDEPTVHKLRAVLRDLVKSGMKSE